MSDVLPYVLGGFLGAGTWDGLRALVTRRRQRVTVTAIEAPGPSGQVEVPVDLAPFRSVLVTPQGQRLIVVRTEHRTGDRAGVSVELLDERDVPLRWPAPGGAS